MADDVCWAQAISAQKENVPSSRTRSAEVQEEPTPQTITEQEESAPDADTEQMGYLCVRATLWSVQIVHGACKGKPKMSY